MPRRRPGTDGPGVCTLTVDLDSQRVLKLLETLEREPAVTQRTLAARLGIALGLANLYIKRLARKGYVKCVTVQPNRLAYLVTPRGLARKAHLTYEFMRYSLDLYRDARRQIREGIDHRVSPHSRVALFGTGEAAELGCLLLADLALKPVAVFDFAEGDEFRGLRVRPLSELGSVAYDVLLVAVLHKTKSTRHRLLAAGVPPDKLLFLVREAAR